nr:nicotinate (nicotinamide) nucleotide adenylyltransferase [Rhodoferax sp.]
MRRMGVFGGAFDPPHVAHVALVQAAVADLQLDELRVVPTGQAWHKARPLSPAHHRLAMAQLAFAELPRVVVDPRETQRVGPSYTVDTLRELKARWPDTELFLVMGEDQARALTGWHEWQEILRLAIICVAEREDLTGARPQFIAQKSHESRFRRLQMPVMPVSATAIRTRIAAHQGLSRLVFEPVARYIDDHHLYQTA